MTIICPSCGHRDQIPERTPNGTKHRCSACGGESTIQRIAAEPLEDPRGIKIKHNPRSMTIEVTGPQIDPEPDITFNAIPPKDSVLLARGLRIAGVGHHDGLHILKRCMDRQQPPTITTQREPDNPYDRNAVAILINGHMLGYLDRDTAERFRGERTLLVVPRTAEFNEDETWAEITYDLYTKQINGVTVLLWLIGLSVFGLILYNRNGWLFTAYLCIVLAVLYSKFQK